LTIPLPVQQFVYPPEKYWEAGKGTGLTSFKQFVAGLLCLMLSPMPALCAPPAGQNAGQISALIPSATRNSMPTKVKDDLVWNDLLKTEQKGRLRAGLTDGSILSLGSNSELRVVQHDAASQQTSLEMNFGKMRSKVVKVTQPNGKFEVKTANAVIGVIGTDFYVSYEANKTTVICYTGKVWVSPIGDAKVVKNSGQSTQDQIQVSAGQMVVISSVIPPAGFQPQSTPPNVMRASAEETSVADLPPPIHHAHLVRDIIIGAAVAGAGWAIGITQLGTSPAPPQVKGCPNPDNPNCNK
jgi:hypothetical protein